jgi:hypothetical protein
MAGIFLGVSAFIGFMLPTLIISAMPRLAIKLLELFRIFSPGTLSVQTTTYVAGDGYYRRGKVYIQKEENQPEKFASAKVFIFLVLIFELIFFILGIAALFLYNFLFPVYY